MVYKKYAILGVKVSLITRNDLMKYIAFLVEKKKQIRIVTPNPEHVMQAQDNRKFREVLNTADIAIPDGIGIVWALKRFVKKNDLKMQSSKIERITGVDLMEKLVDFASRQRWRVGLVGGKRLIRKKLAGDFNLVDCGEHADIVKTWRESESFNDRETKKVLQNIRKEKVDVLFVAYGAPYQELWISHNLQKVSSVKIAMGVGGAFDFLSGEMKRAPSWMINNGLEWLYRLINEPWRYRRQLKLLSFVGHVLTHKDVVSFED